MFPLFSDYFYQMADLVDHTAHGRRIFKFALFANTSQAKPDQCLVLVLRTPRRTASLAHCYCFFVRHVRLLHFCRFCGHFRCGGIVTAATDKITYFFTTLCSNLARVFL